jgi:hypothetical protein
MQAKTISVATIQMEVTPAPVSTRLARAEKLIISAAQSGAQLVVLPELFNTGYSFDPSHHHFAEDIYGPTASWMKACANRNQIHIAGSMMLLDGDEVYNSFLLFAPDGKYWRYDKNYPWGWERSFFREGNRINVAHTNLGDIGMLVCWDTAHPELWRRYAGRVDLMIICTSAPDISNPTFHLPSIQDLTFDDMGPFAQKLKNKGNELFENVLKQQITWLGVPTIVSSAFGKIQTNIPNGFLSFFLFAVLNPKLFKYLPETSQLQMSCKVLTTAKILDAGGFPLVLPNEENEENFYISEIQTSNEKKQRYEPQPKTKLGLQSYIFSDIILPWLSIPMYRKGLRQNWGERMAPIQASTRNWTFLISITAFFAFLLGILFGKRKRK